MMVNRYRAGADFERATRADLHENGYWVMKSAGSKTKVDLLAVKMGEILFIQCKRTALPAPAERVELLRLAGFIDGGAAVIARKGPRGVPVAYERLTGPGPSQRELFVLDEVAS